MSPEYQRALDFIAAANSAPTLAALKAALSSTLEQFGIPHYTVGGMVSLDGVSPPRIQTLIHGTTEAWSEHYWSNGYFNVDAALHLALQQADAFSWSDIEGAHLSRSSQRLFSEIRDALPIKGGFVIPLHDANGFAGIVSLSLEDKTLQPQFAVPLQLISLYALERAKALYALERGAAALPKACPLSARQREILAYAAMGKSEGDTGEILSLSSTTVRDHFIKIRNALGVRTKTQAVAVAVRHGWITL